MRPKTEQDGNCGDVCEVLKINGYRLGDLFLIQRTAYAHQELREPFPRSHPTLVNREPLRSPHTLDHLRVQSIASQTVKRLAGVINPPLIVQF